MKNFILIRSRKHMPQWLLRKPHFRDYTETYMRRALIVVGLLAFPAILSAGIDDNPEVKGQERLFVAAARGAYYFTAAKV
jgi:hypothetical protein